MAGRAGRGLQAVVAGPVRWWARRPPVLRWSAVLAEVAMLWWSSSGPLAGPGRQAWWAVLHEAAHVVAYGVLAALVLLAVRGTAPWRRRDAVLAAAAAFGYGIVDEVHQYFVPGRLCSWLDLVSDAAGAVLGGCLLLGLAGDRAALRWPLALAFAAGAASVASAAAAG